MNSTQRTHLAAERTRIGSRPGWTILESTIVPATRNLLGARRDVAVVLSDSGTSPHRYHVAQTATDMFAGSSSHHHRLDDALDHFRALTGDHAATQGALF